MPHATLTTLSGATKLAADNFLARYAGHTRRAYSNDLGHALAWLLEHDVDPLTASRVDLELYVRHCLDDLHLASATVARRVTTLRSFYKLAHADGLAEKNPAAMVRQPRVTRDESRLIHLDRNELGQIIAHALAAEDEQRAALVVLLGMLGLRVSEACGIQIEDAAHEVRGHRVLKVLGKGSKPAMIPLPVSVQRAIDAAAGDRTTGPLLLGAEGAQLTRRVAHRWVVAVAKRAGIDKPVHPHTLRHAFVTACLDAGVPLRDVQIAARHADPRMTARYDRARGNLDRHAVHVLSAYIGGSTSTGTRRLRAVKAA